MGSDGIGWDRMDHLDSGSDGMRIRRDQCMAQTLSSVGSLQTPRAAVAPLCAVAPTQTVPSPREWIHQALEQPAQHMECVGAFFSCQGQSKQNPSSFFLQLKESINRRQKMWPEKQPSAAECWPVVLARGIMRIAEVPLESALRFASCVLLQHWGAGTAELGQGRCPVLAVSCSPVLAALCTTALQRWGCSPCSGGARLLWSLCWVGAGRCSSPIP